MENPFFVPVVVKLFDQKSKYKTLCAVLMYWCQHRMGVHSVHKELIGLVLTERSKVILNENLFKIVHNLVHNTRISIDFNRFDSL